MIYAPPNTWQELQYLVNKIFNESGLRSETDKEIDTVRGRVNVDVFAIDEDTNPVTTYICECKHWKTNVPKAVVHSFRTVIDDYGANWGFLISSSGFQSGAHEAAQKSQVRLLNWNEYQKLFEKRWIEKYTESRFNTEIYPFFEYVEPFNSRILKKSKQLDPEAQNKIRELREKYQSIGLFFAMLLTPHGFLNEFDSSKLPLRKTTDQKALVDIPDEIINAIFLRDFYDNIVSFSRQVINEFDQIYGERA